LEDDMAKAALEAKSTPTAQAIRRQRIEALIAQRASELFARLAPLVGFSFNHELSAIDVELQSWPGHGWTPEVYDEVETLITDFAGELAAEDPQGAELLRGRTFARHFH
jgi:hypothetical protein